MAHYQYHFSSGSGSTTVVLTLPPEQSQPARIDITSNWMGEGRTVLRVICRHRAVSTTTGMLIVEQVEWAVGDAAPPAWSAAAMGALVTPIVLEYVVLSAPAPVIHHPDAPFETMRQAGYAIWNETFDLLLFLNIMTDIPADFPVNARLMDLDKLKMQRDDTP